MEICFLKATKKEGEKKGIFGFLKKLIVPNLNFVVEIVSAFLFLIFYDRSNIQVYNMTPT